MLIRWGDLKAVQSWIVHWIEIVHRLHFFTELKLFLIVYLECCCIWTQRNVISLHTDLTSSVFFFTWQEFGSRKSDINLPYKHCYCILTYCGLGSHFSKKIHAGSFAAVWEAALEGLKWQSVFLVREYEHTELTQQGSDSEILIKSPDAKRLPWQKSHLH